MTDTKPAIVFIHGGWVCSSIWRLVIPLVEARGYLARTLDLPGCGVHANAPKSYGMRPFDPQLFATEPSPNAGVSQDERTAAAVFIVEKTVAETGRPVVLVGQSLGGLTVSAVAEAVPQLLHATVYISAFLQSPGVSMMALAQHETSKDSLVPTLLSADPAVVGACRIDFKSTDSAFRAQMKKTFCHDFTESDSIFDAANSDEPLGVMVRPAELTAERFGQVKRHYIRCIYDHSIPIQAQDHMIKSVDTALGSKTQTHTLESSHFPFFAHPERLAEILDAAASTAGR